MNRSEEQTEEPPTRLLTIEHAISIAKEGASIMLTRAKVLGATSRLRVICRDQIARFDSYSRMWPSVFDSVRRYEDSVLMDPTWIAFSNEIERALTRRRRLDFLRHRPIWGAIYSERGGKQVEYELGRLLSEDRFTNVPTGVLLREDVVGLPRLCDSNLLCSTMTIQHAFHMSVLSASTSARFSDLSFVVEWGGGYGGFARLVRRIRPDLTYLILDTPVAISLQWLYLGSVYGKDSVRIISNSNSHPEPNKINLLPVGLKDVDIPAPDLFVSTFALSESSLAAIRYVKERGWFESRHVLLAYQTKHPSFAKWRLLEGEAENAGATISRMPHRPDDCYALK
jgi:hypothetical protein